MNSLNNLNARKWLFTWLEPPEGFIGTPKSTTNSLEGGINSPLKLLARNHRGMSKEHQRTAIDWWLASKTQLPADPVKTARQQRWGKDALAKVNALLEAESPTPPKNRWPKRIRHRNRYHVPALYGNTERMAR